MHWFTALAIVAATSVHAEGHYDAPSMHDPEIWYEHANGNQPYFGTITHLNQITNSTDQTLFDIETPHGTVTVKLTRTKNYACSPACPDTLEVVSMPDGVAAVPMAIETPERGAGFIRLFPLLGV